MFVVLSVLHGGKGLPIFSASVYQYIASGSHTSIDVPICEIPDHTLKFIVQKVCIGAIDCERVLTLTVCIG